MATDIHPLAVVDAAAQLGDGCKIGPYCTIGPHVEIGNDTHLQSHIVIDGRTRLGSGWPFSAFYSVASGVSAPPDDAAASPIRMISHSNSIPL